MQAKQVIHNKNWLTAHTQGGEEILESLQRLNLKGFEGGGGIIKGDLREIDELDNIKVIIGTQVSWVEFLHVLI